MPDNELKKGQKASGIAAMVSFLLAIAKAFVGFLSGSIALLSDAVDSISDVVVMVVSWIGLRISQRDPNEKFPYGYYKAESLATLFVSVAILYAAFQLLFAGYERLFVIAEIEFPVIEMSVALVSCATAFGVSRYLDSVGKAINSQLLLTSSRERIKDVLASLAVFVAVLMTYLKLPYVEGAVTIAISLLIFRFGIISVKDSVLALMDTSPSRDVEGRIKNILKDAEGVDDFSNLKLRKSGPFVFGEARINVSKSISVKRAHEIADGIESRIKSNVREVHSFIIHVEPYKGERHRIVIPVSDDRGLDSPVMNHFGRATHFIFVDVNKGKVTKISSKENPFSKKSVRAGLSVAHYMVDEKVDILMTREIGAISFHTLRDHLVEIYMISGKTAGEVVDNFLKSKLTRLKEHTREKD